ncbi:MAG: hypothetical protein V4864_24615 [Pseudomonadota bacterium]
MADNLVTLANIREHVYDHGFESDSAARIARIANAGQRKVIGEKRFRFMRASTTIALVAGTDTYAVPTTSPPVMHAESLRIADITDIEYRSPDEVLDAKARGDSVGQWWTLLTPTSIMLYPAPTVAASATFRYLKSPTDMSSDSSEPDIPLPYRDILVAHTCAVLAGRQRQWDSSSAFAADRDERARAMRAQYGIEQTQSASQVQRSGRHTYSDDYGIER